MTDPYIGLRPYAIGERGRFFGREREARDLRNLWMSNRLVVVYGASGVGKTSLVQAGALAGIRTSGPKQEAVALPVGRLPQGTSYPSMAPGGRSPLEFALVTAWEPHATTREVMGHSLVDLLRRIPSVENNYGDPLPILAVIDQFEQLFLEQPNDRSAPDEFLQVLAEASEKVAHLHLLFSIREEYVGRLIAYETRIAGYSRARFEVLPLATPMALAAVTGPLRGTDRSYTPGAAESLVDDLRTVTFVDGVGERSTIVGNAVDPVQLQIVCEELWTSLSDDVRTITQGHITARGDVDQLLLNFCRRTVGEAARAHAVEEARIWAWLGRVFVTDTGRRGTAYEGVTSTGGMPNEVARDLEKRRLLRRDERTGSSWYELQSDRLIQPVEQGVASARPLDDLPVMRERVPVNYLRTAEAAFARGNLEQAERYARDGLAITDSADTSGRREALFFLGRLAAAQDDPRAEEYFRDAQSLFVLPRDARAISSLQLELGRLYLRQNRIVQAQEELERALRGPGDRAVVRIELARALRAAGQPAAALAHLQAVLTVEPNHLVALLERGLTREAMNDWDGARIDLADAIRLSPLLADRADVRRIITSAERSGPVGGSRRPDEDPWVR